MSPGTGFRIVEKRLVAETPLIRLEEIDLETPDGSIQLRTAVRFGGAVAVVPVVDDEVVLIRQYRTPLDAPLLELPAGKLDVPGEDRAVAAARELEEEVGYRAGHLEQVARFFTSPGFADEEMTVFIATDLTPTATNPMGAEEVAAEIVRIAIADIPKILSEIEDSKTVIGLMALLLRQHGVIAPAAGP
ncbi:MAG: NUDIX hydrolase [bacterium]|nr:NUDIX hydrolase [bacterium]